MPNLFGQPDAPLPDRPDRPVGPFAVVALENALDKTLDYGIPRRLLGRLKVGQRVKAPLGRSNRATFGVVVALTDSTEYPKIKDLLAIDDDRVLIAPNMMRLARWMSRYYCTPLGTVLETIIPAAVKRRTGAGVVHKVRLNRPREEIQTLLGKTKGKKRKAILGRLLLVEPGHDIELNHLAGEAGTTPATVRQLAKTGLITLHAETDFGAMRAAVYQSQGAADAVPEPELNPDQAAVMAELTPRMRGGAFSVNLLLGVTGSGKTEIYLRCLREVIALGRQAIVLVPEIALTPQTVRRFTQRFPRVAVLHSGLSSGDRHRYWQQIATGGADVVVGARSAVFAPLPNVGLIVVDEEHEASYKQDTAPRYQGRDVAVMRARIESAAVLLGSATPSLEMYAKVQRQPDDDKPWPYHLLSLPRRVRGLKMPAVELVDMKQEARFRRGVHLLGQRLERLLEQELAEGHQAILLLNRRGYSNFVHCSSCQSALQCKYCDTTVTYHRNATADVQTASFDVGKQTGQLHCHYCLAVTPLPPACPACGKKLSLFGLGTQRVEEELKRKFPNITYARVDSDTMRSAKDYEDLLGRFGRGELQVMLGTQMIAKGLDYPNVTLVGVVSGDTALSLPDFRASERTFQLITQVAGRAGRGDAPGRVVLQTFQPDDPTIQSALRQDFAGFATKELALRREVGLPPYARMARIILRDQDLQTLQEHSEKLAADVADAVAMENLRGPSSSRIVMKGPMPCAIGRIAGYHRYQLLLSSARGERLQRVLAAIRDKGDLKKAERVAVDVDPVSLL